MKEDEEIDEEKINFISKNVSFDIEKSTCGNLARQLGFLCFFWKFLEMLGYFFL